MPNGTVIVALPNEDDYVHRISSEEKPHMTLLYLGDVSAEDQAKIAEFLQHAATTTLQRFGLTVDRRDTLGPKDADVLFFNGRRALKEIEDFNHALLQNDTINTSYNTTEQFPEWTPHLTLGYPETPAKEDTREYPGINYVNFDRVALWVGDYDGPEFRLKDWSDMELAMSDSELTEFFAHILESSTEPLEHGGISDIGGPSTTPPDPSPRASKREKEAFKKYWNAMLAWRNKAAAGLADIFGAGTTVDNFKQKLDRATPAQRQRYQAFKGQMSSSYKRDVHPLAEAYLSMQHSDEDLDNFLMHFGVRGMKWGVRKSSDSSSDGMTSAAAAKSHNDTTDKIVNGIKAAKTDGQVEAILNRAEKSGHVEANVKISGREVSPDGKSVRYQIKAYRVTPGMRNASTGDGVKVEHVTKEVKRLASINKTRSDKLWEAGGAVTDALWLSTLAQADTPEFDNFLEHHGIKGMRWGVRRSDAQLAKSGKKSGDAPDAAKSDDKKDDEKFVSADAERFVKTLQKEGHEMSDREIKEAVNRANIVEQYNAKFGTDPNRELRSKVEALNLQKEYAGLKAELTPSKMKTVKSFLDSAASGWSSMQKLDEATGNAMSDYLKGELGKAFEITSKAASTPKPPKAPSYSGAGKRRVGVPVGPPRTVISAPRLVGKHRKGE